MFSGPRGAFAVESAGDGADRPEPAGVVLALPVPLIDRDDPAALLLSTGARNRDEITQLAGALPDGPTVELRLALIRADLDAGELQSARSGLDELAAEDTTDDWRLHWYRGVSHLLDDPAAAVVEFDRCWSRLPGELAPKLALAAAAEIAGDAELAGSMYGLIATLDPTLADAPFGVARVQLRAGRPAAARQALDRVPASSSGYAEARRAAAESLLTPVMPPAALLPAALLPAALPPAGLPTEDELWEAVDRIERLRLEPGSELLLKVRVLEVAIDMVLAGRFIDQSRQLFGSPLVGRDLHLALEQTLRQAARHSTSEPERYALIDRAHAAHPRTWR